MSLPEYLSPSLVFDRLIHLIEYYEKHQQKQSFATPKKRITDSLFSVRIYGIGFDRWHFFILGNRECFLVSLYHVNEYLYINYDVGSCKICDKDESRDKIYQGVKRIIEHKDESWLTDIEKISKAEEKMAILQGHVDAAKKGEFSGFVNKIGKKKKK